MENNIHQIWVGNNRIPTHIKEWMDEVKEQHKDFTYYFWNDENLPELPEHLKKVYDSYKEPAIKADLLRMYVVHKFGGIYLDADFKPIDGFHTSIMPCKDCGGFVVYNDSYGMSALANTIFGFSKDNALLKYLLDDVLYEMQWIGPNWWAQTVCKYLQVDFNKITIPEFKEKLSEIDIELVRWKDIEDKCFRHEALASWIHGSIWNNKLKTGDYD